MHELIYDVGMNNGDDSAFYLARGFRVVAIEADPSLAVAGRERFSREIGDGRLTLLNVGVAAEEGEAEFWICETKNEWNSFDRSIASRDNSPHHAIRIPTRPFGTILQEFGVPHYLKVDIEGQDSHCLAELLTLRQKAMPRYISWEHDGELGPLETVRRLGFSRFKLIDQSTFSPITARLSVPNVIDSVARHAIRRLRRVSLPGSRVVQDTLTHRGRLERRFGREFPMGSSGPWGDEMPGRWLSFGEARELLNYSRSESEDKPGRPAHSFWCDWHAAT
jgi:FkbM family methyltransferase